MEKERRKTMNVSDKKAELWIKIIGLVAMISLPVLGGMGKLYLDAQERSLVELKAVNRQLNALTGLFKAIEPRVSRNERDIEVLNEEVFRTSSRRNSNGLH